MKFFASLFGILSFASTANCQTNIYHPFVHDGAKWNILSYRPDISDSLFALLTYYSEGDTSIDSKDYFKIRYIFDGGYAEFIKEDTIEKKVFYKSTILGISDTLLFDFSLLVGESASHTYSFSEFDSSFVYLIDSAFVGDNYRKRFNIIYYYKNDSDTTIHGVDTTYWIEGIGGVFGISPYFMGFGYPDTIIPSGNWIKNLLCYSEGEEVQYSIPNIYASCDSFYNHVINYSIETRLFPNPVRIGNFLNMDINKFDNFIQIFSINGSFIEEMYEFNNHIQHPIKTNLYTPGLYILYIHNNSSYPSINIFMVTN